MYKTDNVLLHYNRYLHLARLEVFEGLTDAQSQELVNLSFIHGNDTFKRPVYDGPSGLTPYNEAESPSKTSSILVDFHHSGLIRSASYEIVEWISATLRRLNTTPTTQEEVNGYVFELLNSMDCKGVYPIAAPFGSLFTVYPIPSTVEQHKDLNKWGDVFFTSPSYENFLSLAGHMEAAGMESSTFVPFYENNFSLLHSTITGMMWAINSPTFLYHFTAALCSKEFTKTLKEVLGREDELKDINKYFKSIYNDAILSSEEHGVENAVELRSLLLVNILTKFMEVVK